MRYLSTILFSMICLPAFAADFKCDNRVTATYSPGPNWSQLKDVSPLHIQFISDRMDAGDILEAGPFIGQQGMTGGFMVYNNDDAKVVEEFVKQDPFVKQGVATYELRTWMKCTK